MAEEMDLQDTMVSMEPMRALIYETIGDEAASEADRAFTRSSRGLDMTMQSLNIFPADSMPPVLLLFGGYLSEIKENTAFAAFAYRTGLNIAPNDYLLHWRQAVFSEQQGDYKQAFQHYTTSIENAPVPFPVAAYQQAILLQKYRSELDSPQDACELLAKAKTDAETNPDLYAVLLEKIMAAQHNFQCRQGSRPG